MNPVMQQQDPMCWQAFQANPDTMWNWMSQLRDGLAGQYQARTPDGQLCSNALSRNNSLNQPGAWKATNVSPNFTVQLYDQASHGADYFRVYVTKQGFNRSTQQVGWGNLDLIATTGRYAPAQNISFNVSASGRIWKPRPVRDLEGVTPGPDLHVVQRHQHHLIGKTPQHDPAQGVDALGRIVLQLSQLAAASGGAWANAANGRQSLAWCQAVSWRTISEESCRFVIFANRPLPTV